MSAKGGPIFTLSFPRGTHRPPCPTVCYVTGDAPCKITAAEAPPRKETATHRVTFAISKKSGHWPETRPRSRACTARGCRPPAWWGAVSLCTDGKRCRSATSFVPWSWVSWPASGWSCSRDAGSSGSCGGWAGWACCNPVDKQQRRARYMGARFGAKSVDAPWRSHCWQIWALDLDYNEFLGIWKELMENCGIFGAKNRIYLLDWIWTSNFKNILDYIWSWTEF